MTSEMNSFPISECKKVYINGSPNQYLKLNVGGKLFQTTIDTLCKYDSMLRAMFSGRIEVLTDFDGYVLIDRSGKHFDAILDFLRQGTIPLPECRAEVAEILCEARFYLIQELINHCVSWLHYLNRVQKELIRYSLVPVVSCKEDVEKIVQYCSDRPVIEFLINRQNNKFSYTHQSDENFLRNQEIFDKLVQRFKNRVLCVKNMGVDSSEICQWSFYANGKKINEISCTSIVYATDKKQTKVEVFEARIYDEAMNILLSTDLGQPTVCGQCRGMSATSAGITPTDTPIPFYSSAPATPMATMNNNSSNLMVDVLCTSLLRQHLKMDTIPTEHATLAPMTEYINGDALQPINNSTFNFPTQQNLNLNNSQSVPLIQGSSTANLVNKITHNIDPHHYSCNKNFNHVPSTSQQTNNI